MKTPGQVGVRPLGNDRRVTTAKAVGFGVM